MFLEHNQIYPDSLQRLPQSELTIPFSECLQTPIHLCYEWLWRDFSHLGISNVPTILYLVYWPRLHYQDMWIESDSGFTDSGLLGLWRSMFAVKMNIALSRKLP